MKKIIIANCPEKLKISDFINFSRIRENVNIFGRK